MRFRNVNLIDFNTIFNMSLDNKEILWGLIVG
jgi:hypothetical protein